MGHEKCVHGKQLTQQRKESFIASTRQLDPSNRNQTRTSNTKSTYYELKTRLEMSVMEKVHQHAGEKRKEGWEGSSDGAQWNCAANLLPDLLLLW